jgi:hypothetical protein
MSWATLSASANRVAFARLGSVNVTAGAVTAQGFLVMPGQILADGMSISTDYTLTALAVDFGNLIYGASVTVESTLYTVRDNRLLDDGGFCEISLQKVVTDTGLVTDPAIDGGGANSIYLDGNVFDGGGA